MSVQILHDVFNALPSCDAWSLQLLKIKTSSRANTTYMSREIAIKPAEQLDDFVSEIAKSYIGPIGSLKEFKEVRNYDGSALNKTIYKLPINSKLIETEYRALTEAIKAPDAEIDPFELKFKAYLLIGRITIGEEEYPVKLVSMQNPITMLRHKFLNNNGAFTEIGKKVLSLRTTVDVVIFDEKIYMLTLAGENLFNMERSYKAVCATKVENIGNCDIVTDFEAFAATAKRGQNPRKFVSFNDAHLEKLKCAGSRKKIAQKFDIPLSDNKFDTTQPGTADKLVKLLCEKGMVDPFDDNPMEVEGSKKWR